MNRNLNPVRASLLATLACVASVANAQVTTPPFVAQITMVSSPLPDANEFRCTVVNVSSQPVSLNTLYMVDNGVALANSNASCTGTLAAGDSCTVRSQIYPNRGQIVPHCRARSSGQHEQALVGSMRSSYIYNGTYFDLAVVPLQLLKGVTLSTYTAPLN